MKPNYFFLKFLLGIMLLSCNWGLQAARPLWTFTPLTPTTVVIAKNGTAVVSYVVTNQSKEPHILSLVPTQGITQITTEGTCQTLFSLSYLQSCILVLSINGSALNGNLIGGPVVCQLGNPLQCYRPSPPDILNITVLPQTEGTVGGTVSGLIGELVLANGSATLTISTDGPFTFPPILAGQPYNVVVQTQPATQTCTVFNGTGVMGSTSVTDVVVTCSVNAYPVGGTVSGLIGSLELQLNGGSPLTINSDGVYSFPDDVAQGSPYEVTILSSPATQTCTIENPEGTMGNAAVTDVNVVCSTTSYTVGGTVTGITGGGTLVLETNNQSISITQNGSFQFPDPLADGSTYEVINTSDPADENCVVTNGQGTISGSNVTNVLVTCNNLVTTLSVVPRGVIVVGGATTNIAVTNTGTHPALNVRATLPSGWSSVVQDASACTTLAPTASCNLVFSSPNAGFVSSSAVITGDNIENAPTTTLAFALSLMPGPVNYLIYAVDSATSYRVVSNTQEMDGLSLRTSAWSSAPTTFVPGALSLVNGLSNTQAIAAFFPPPATAAANYCYNDRLPVNTWFLPAVCETAPLTTTSPLCQNTPTFNPLITAGFLSFPTLLSANGKQVYTYTSTQEGANLRLAAFTGIMPTGSGVGYSAEFKTSLFYILCARNATFP